MKLLKKILIQDLEYINMDCVNPRCLGKYDFERIAFFAIKRFVEGCSTIDLMKAATTDQEKEEIALVSFLDMDDENIRDLMLCCNRAAECESIRCREKLRRIVENALVKRR